jgi:hypothetical protein
MSGDDEMDPNTRVPVVRCAWGGCGHVLSCQTLNVAASRGPDSDGACLVLKASGRVLGRGVTWSRLTCGEILLAHDYRDRGTYWCRLLMCLVLFRLVVPPLQPGVVGPYPLQDV